MSAARKAPGRFITVDHDRGTAKVQGIDLGPNVMLVAMNDKAIVLKSAGHSYWSGRGMRAYASPTTYTYLIVGESTTAPGVYEVEGLIEVEHTRTKVAK